MIECSLKRRISYSVDYINSCSLIFKYFVNCMRSVGGGGYGIYDIEYSKFRFSFGICFDSSVCIDDFISDVYGEYLDYLNISLMFEDRSYCNDLYCVYSIGIKDISSLEYLRVLFRMRGIYI